MRKLMALMALTTLTACDVSERRDVRGERDDRTYRAAMDDYRSGNLDKAIEGFEKAVRKDPANASARFQLACLQQDAKRNWLEAFFGYREYLMQHPESDKAPLARDRMKTCEREMAVALATKFGLNDSAALAKELGNVRKELKSAEARIAAAEKNLGESQARVRSLSAERDRLVKIVKGGTDVAAEVAKPSAVEVKDLLEEADESSVSAPEGEVARLKGEESAENDAGSEILAPRIAATNRVAKAREQPKKRPSAPPEHPATYVVQEGDTLYSVAKKFYGKVSAWKQIRNANKALISMDNRLRAGDTLVLP